MRSFLIPLVLVCLVNVTAQDNYFVNYGLLSQLRQAHDTGYLGIDSANNLVKVDHNFGFEWSVGSFEYGIEDLHVEQFGQIYVLGRTSTAAKLTVISSVGDVISEDSLHLDALGQTEFERWSSGYVFAFNCITPSTSATGSVLIVRTDLGLNIEWVKAIDALDGFGIGLTELEVRGDTITVLYHNGFAGLYVNILSRFLIDGTHLWSKHIGSNCPYYRDFAQLTTGEFVLVGQGENYDYWQVFKLTVLSNDGTVLSTKERHYSDTDSETDIAYVVPLNDGRYAVSLYFYEDMGGGLDGAIICFDNHKPVMHWCFQPFWIGGDMGESFNLWNVDDSNQFLFSGFVTSYDVDSSEYVMGRMSWLSEDCGVGFQTNYAFGYGLDPSEPFEPDAYEITINDFSPYSDTLTPQIYSNILKCSNTAFDPGPAVTENHLYGTMGDSCPFTSFWGVGIAESELKSGGIYPNPATEHFSIDCEGDIELSISTPEGKILIQRKVLERELIDITGLKTGIYSVEWTTEYSPSNRSMLIKL